MIYTEHRPEECRGHGDSRLAQLVRDTRRILQSTQREFANYTLHVGPDSLGDLAGLLVDFAEDLHNGTGIWDAYERYNVEFFGSPLPLTTEEGGAARKRLHPDRFRHFLWILYPLLIDRLTMSPGHQDLRRMAEASSLFLSGAFSALPKTSSVKTFLQTPNVRAADVKRKLAWLGCHSFMFRTMFARYMEDKTRGSDEIGHIDDFVCEHCTRWSGLGVIDILARILDISEHDRNDLRNWCERHTAFYRIVSKGAHALQALNLINDQPYGIRIDVEENPFRVGQVVCGSLVPWRRDWYWSGVQKAWGDASEMAVNGLKESMKRRPRIACRYWKDYEAQVRKQASNMYARALAYYGKDLIVYPDGLSMAADLEKELRSYWESMPEEEQRRMKEKHRLKEGRPRVNLPRELLDHADGVGVFLSPDEGREIMTHFTALIAGMERKGEALTDDQVHAIQSFFEQSEISPRFVKRVLDEYGAESVKTTFLLKGDLPSYWIDYLLRCRKGHFYRKRYPPLALI